jgi:hypothetical protein
MKFYDSCIVSLLMHEAQCKVISLCNELSNHNLKTYGRVEI